MLSVDNPATGEIFCEIETASAEDAAQIVGRARAAADTLAELDLAERIELCSRFIDRFAANRERIARDVDALTDVKTADWSKEVTPFWRAVISVALTRRGVLGLLRAGPATVRGGLVMPLMQKGLRDGTIKFNLITATKRA